MSYINPYELLGINTTNLSDIDSKTILREKKKLFQEIDLSYTDSIEHNSKELTKSDCLQAIEDLDDINKREFHFFIFKNNHLNNFLSTGSLTFFEKYQIESIYKLPGFLDFISPYFAFQYDNALADNFRKQNINALSKILSVKPITNALLLDSCYNGIYTIVKNLINEIGDITEQIELDQSPFIDEDFSGLDSLIKEKVNVTLINLLPAYFQSLRNQLAQSIRNIATNINNDPYSLYEPAYKIIEIANGFSTDGLIRQKITKGYYTINKNYEDNFPKYSQASKISTPVSIKPVLAAEETITTGKSIKEESNDNSAMKILAGVSIVISGLFLWSFFNTTIQKAMLSIGALLSIGWLCKIVKNTENFNKHLKEQVLVYSLSFIVCIAGFFYPILSILFDSYFLIVFLHLFYNSLSLKSPGANTVYKYLILAIAITTLWYYNQPNIEPDPQQILQESPVQINRENSLPPGASDPTETISKYNSTPPIHATETQTELTKKSMKSGNIPDCFGISPKYNNAIKTILIISAESTDVAVKIFDNQTNKCIRVVFINDGTTYTVKNIPEGKYYLKIAYGNDWSVKEGDPIKVFLPVRWDTRHACKVIKLPIST